MTFKDQHSSELRVFLSVRVEVGGGVGGKL